MILIALACPMGKLSPREKVFRTRRRLFHPPYRLQIKVCELMQFVRYKYIMGKSARDYGKFSRFLEGTFSRKSVANSERRGQFQPRKFKNLFEHVTSNYIKYNYIKYLFSLSRPELRNIL